MHNLSLILSQKKALPVAALKNMTQNLLQRVMQSLISSTEHKRERHTEGRERQERRETKQGFCQDGPWRDQRLSHGSGSFSPLLLMHNMCGLVEAVLLA